MLAACGHQGSTEASRPMLVTQEAVSWQLTASSSVDIRLE